jgi:hypothetical protein
VAYFSTLADLYTEVYPSTLVALFSTLDERKPHQRRAYDAGFSPLLELGVLLTALQASIFQTVLSPQRT